MLKRLWYWITSQTVLYDCRCCGMPVVEALSDERLCGNCFMLYIDAYKKGYEQLRKDILEKRVFIEGFWKV